MVSNFCCLRFYPGCWSLIILIDHWSFFWRSFIASIRWSSSILTSIGAILSLGCNASVGVDFMTLKMSIKALFWAASESLQCLHVYIVCPQIMLPYSSLEQMKDLKIQTARFVHMSWNSVYLLYTFLHLLAMYSMWSVKVRSSSMTTSSTHWEGTFLSGVPLMLNGIGGEARYSFCCRKSSMLFSWYL